MKSYFIITGTVTYALRGRDVLRKKGYSAIVKRIQHKYNNAGCGYGIIISGDVERASQLLRENGIKILGTEVLDD
ncbi:MAG: DUF3343 domain-containing protein [Oscillospiraceae bacterium]|nr:DUF3343 domain-containing protein [Oscillospiraceae bacterium]